MPKYLDLEAHYEADMSAIFGVKKQTCEQNTPTVQEQEKTDVGDK